MSAKTSKNSKKQDLTEKVQEIQKRQKNWLKQREDHKKTETVDKPESKSYTPPAQNKPGKSLSSSSNYGNKNKYKLEHSVEKTSSSQPKDRFQSWMEERENPEKIKLQEPDVLQVSSSRTPGFATPDPDWEPSNDYSSHGNHLGKHDHREEVANNLMSHQDFDEMANKIVARVKNELDIPYKSTSKPNNSYSGYEQSNLSLKTVNKDAVRTDYCRERNTDDPSSHFCPECQRLMLSSDNVPMILTPCAHSMCQSCCQGRSLCPQCACSISSKTCNIMLLQIIQNHQKTRETTPEHRKQHAYSPDNYREKAKTRQQYHEEYENLQMRQEVLQIESREIQGHMTKLTNKIAQQQQQMQNIEREEKKVKDKIQSLKEKLVELDGHRQEYDRGIQDIEMEKKKDRNKLNMVQDTLSSIEIEMEKIVAGKKMTEENQLSQKHVMEILAEMNG